MRLKFFFSYSLLVLSEMFKLLVLLFWFVVGVLVLVVIAEDVETVIELALD